MKIRNWHGRGSMGKFLRWTVRYISRIYGKTDNVRRVSIIQGNRIAAFPSLRILIDLSTDINLINEVSFK